MPTNHDETLLERYQREERMKPYIDLGHTETFPTIGANATGEGDVILSFSSYPASSTMCVPLSVAIELANKILSIANGHIQD